MTLYYLEHIYDDNGQDEIKHIGVFSTLNKANMAIEHLKSLPGFSKHSIECFHIYQAKVDYYEKSYISWHDVELS